MENKIEMNIAYLWVTQYPHLKLFVDYFSNNNCNINLFGRTNIYKDYSNVQFYDLSLSRKNKKFSNFVNKSGKIPRKKKTYKHKILQFGVSSYDFLRIRARMNKIKPDIVHGFDPVNFGLKTVFSGNYPKVLTCLGSDIFRYPWESKITFKKVDFSLKNVDIIHVRLNYMKEFISKNFNIDKNIIQAIPFGINRSFFNKKNISVEKLNQLKTKMKIKEEDIVILYPKGFRDSEKQNYIKLLQAFAEIAKIKKNVKLIMLSYGFNNDIKELESIIKKNQLNNRVTLIYDYLPQDTILHLYYLSQIIVIIPDTDQLSCSILESMSIETIPVLSDLEIYRQNLTEGKNCLYVDPKDPNSIKNTILDLIDNLNKYKSNIIERNKIYVKENFDYKIQMQKMRNLYRELIS